MSARWTSADLTALQSKRLDKKAKAGNTQIQNL